MVHLLLPVLLAHDGAGVNLIANGNFEAGATGFVTAYQQSNSIVDTGTFAITTDPRKVHDLAFSIRDHSGKGSMLAMNGSAERNVTVWQSTVKIVPHKKYTFTGWSTSWSQDVSDGKGFDTSPAALRVYINGKPTGAVYGVNANSGRWNKFVYEWDADSKTTATIRIVDVNIDGQGNDFALDDLSLVASK